MAPPHKRTYQAVTSYCAESLVSEEAEASEAVSADWSEVPVEVDASVSEEVLSAPSAEASDALTSSEETVASPVAEPPVPAVPKSAESDLTAQPIWLEDRSNST